MANVESLNAFAENTGDSNPAAQKTSAIINRKAATQKTSAAAKFFNSKANRELLASVIAEASLILEPIKGKEESSPKDIIITEETQTIETRS